MRASKLSRLERSQLVRRPTEEVFAFFSDAGNLEVLTPAFLRFRILTPLPIEMRAGARIDYSLSLFGAPIRWRTCITQWEPGVRFVDEQESGPYSYWRHVHEFERKGKSTLVRDTVDYAVPLGPIGTFARLAFVDRTLARIFDFRRDAIRHHLEGRAQEAPTPHEGFVR